MIEKTTAWDAPVKPKMRHKLKSLKKGALWEVIKRTWFYFPLMALPILSIVTTPGKPHAMSAGNLGFIIGLTFATVLHVLSERMTKSLHKMELDMAKFEGAMEVVQRLDELERNRPARQGTPSTDTMKER